MPRATAVRDTVKVDLTTVPEGWVELRRMDFGEVLNAQDNSFEAVVVESDESKANGNRAARRGDKKNEDMEMRTRMSTAKATAKAFASCIVDHNLEDEKGRKLDFTRREDVFALDLKIADEIETLINRFNEVGELGNSNSTSGGSSTAE